MKNASSAVRGIAIAFALVGSTLGAAWVCQAAQQEDIKPAERFKELERARQHYEKEAQAIREKIDHRFDESPDEAAVAKYKAEGTLPAGEEFRELAKQYEDARDELKRAYIPAKSSAETDVMRKHVNDELIRITKFNDLIPWGPNEVQQQVVLQPGEVKSVFRENAFEGSFRVEIKANRQGLEGTLLIGRPVRNNRVDWVPLVADPNGEYWAILSVLPEKGKINGVIELGADRSALSDAGEDAAVAGILLKAEGASFSVTSARAKKLVNSKLQEPQKKKNGKDAAALMPVGSLWEGESTHSAVGQSDVIATVIESGNGKVVLQATWTVHGSIVLEWTLNYNKRNLTLITVAGPRERLNESGNGSVTIDTLELDWSWHWIDQGRDTTTKGKMTLKRVK